MIKKVLILLISLLLIINLTGCMDYKSLENLSAVIGIAVDESDKAPNIFHVSFEIIDTLSASAENGKVSYIAEADGVSVLDAVTNANKKLANELYFGNAELLIINEKIAKDRGIGMVLENFFRGFPVLDSLQLIISKAKDAKSLICNGKSNKNEIIYSYNIVRSLDNQTNATDTVHSLKVYEVYDSLKKGIECITLPAYKIGGGEKNPEPVIDGLAIFKKDRLAGYIDDDEKKYFSFEKDNLAGGNIVFTLGSQNPEYVTYNILNSKPCINIDYKDNILNITVNISAHVKISGLYPQTVELNQSKVNELEKKSGQDLKEHIKLFTEHIQKDFNTDIFGFALNIYRYNNKLWGKIKNNWDEVLRKAHIKVNVSFKIKDTGLVGSGI